MFFCSLIVHQGNHSLGDVWISDLNKHRLFLRFLLSFTFDWEDISNTQGNIQPHFQTRWISSKNSAARRILNSLLGVWRWGQTRSFVFDVIYQIREIVPVSSGYPSTEKSWKYDAQRSIFLRNSRCLDSRWKTLSRVFDISSQSKQKLRSKRRSKIVQIYAN